MMNTSSLSEVVSFLLDVILRGYFGDFWNVKEERFATRDSAPPSPRFSIIVRTVYDVLDDSFKRSANIGDTIIRRYSSTTSTKQMSQARSDQLERSKVSEIKAKC